jgi:hypothetical protein
MKKVRDILLWKIKSTVKSYHVLTLLWPLMRLEVAPVGRYSLAQALCSKSVNGKVYRWGFGFRPGAEGHRFDLSLSGAIFADFLDYSSSSVQVGWR